MNPLIYNTLQFEKYSLLTIFLLKNLGFLAKNPKTNSKFEKKKNPLIVELVEISIKMHGYLTFRKKGAIQKLFPRIFPVGILVPT